MTRLSPQQLRDALISAGLSSDRASQLSQNLAKQYDSVEALVAVEPTDVGCSMAESFKFRTALSNLRNQGPTPAIPPVRGGGSGPARPFGAAGGGSGGSSREPPLGSSGRQPLMSGGGRREPMRPAPTSGSARPPIPSPSSNVNRPAIPPSVGGRRNTDVGKAAPPAASKKPAVSQDDALSLLDNALDMFSMDNLFEKPADSTPPAQGLSSTNDSVVESATASPSRHVSVSGDHLQDVSESVEKRHTMPPSKAQNFGGVRGPCRIPLASRPGDLSTGQSNDLEGQRRSLPPRKAQPPAPAPRSPVTRMKSEDCVVRDRPPQVPLPRMKSENALLAPPAPPVRRQSVVVDDHSRTDTQPFSVGGPSQQQLPESTQSTGADENIVREPAVPSPQQRQQQALAAAVMQRGSPNPAASKPPPSSKPQLPPPRPQSRVIPSGSNPSPSPDSSRVIRSGSNSSPSPDSVQAKPAPFKLPPSKAYHRPGRPGPQTQKAASVLYDLVSSSELSSSPPGLTTHPSPEQNEPMPDNTTRMKDGSDPSLMISAVSNESSTEGTSDSADDQSDRNAKEIAALMAQIHALERGQQAKKAANNNISAAPKNPVAVPRSQAGPPDSNTVGVPASEKTQPVAERIPVVAEKTENPPTSSQSSDPRGTGKVREVTLSDIVTFFNQEPRPPTDVNWQKVSRDELAAMLVEMAQFLKGSDGSRHQEGMRLMMRVAQALHEYVGLLIGWAESLGDDERVGVLKTAQGIRVLLKDFALGVRECTVYPDNPSQLGRLQVFVTKLKKIYEFLESTGVEKRLAVVVARENAKQGTGRRLTIGSPGDSPSGGGSSNEGFSSLASSPASAQPTPVASCSRRSQPPTQTSKAPASGNEGKMKEQRDLVKSILDQYLLRGDILLMEGFLQGYQSQLTLLCPHYVLLALIERYGHPEVGKEMLSQSDCKKRQLNVCRALRHWIKHFPVDFQQENMDSELRSFCNVLNADGLKVTAESLLQDLADPEASEERQQEKRQEPESQDVFPLVMCYNAQVIAQQLTRIDSAVFRKIPSRAFVIQSEKQARSAMWDRFNQEAWWVGSEIVKCKKQETRIQLIQFFIEVADIIQRVFSNYHGCLAIVSGLNSSPVERMKKTWSALPDDARKRFQDLNDLCNPGDGTFPNLMKRWSVSTSPCVPHIGSYVTLMDRYKVKLQPADRFAKEAEITRTINMFQHVGTRESCVRPAPLNELCDYLEAAPYLTENEQFALSLVLEPRQ